MQTIQNVKRELKLWSSIKGFLDKFIFKIY